MTHRLVQTIRRSVAEAADPVKAAQMQAYMKSAMPYRGVSAPLLKTLCRDAFRALPIDSAAEWQRVVLELWRNARFREERYVVKSSLRTRARSRSI